MRKIKYIVKYEDMISRIPGLFPYIEENTLGVSELHKATDSKQGCYGKIVQNMNIGGKTYTYRQMMDKYYSEYDNLGDTDPTFKQFVEKGIGKIKVDKTISGDLIPEYVYLSNVSALFNEYALLEKTCNLYQYRVEHGEKEDPHMCCECERFERMGGHKMTEWLKEKIPIAESIANKFFENAKKTVKLLTIDFMINLTNHNNDMGIVTPYIEEWIAGKRYYEGDKVFYNENIYTTKKENCGHYDEESETIVFPGTDNGYFEKDKEFTYDVVNDLILSGNCNGKLKSLRRYIEYLNGYDERELPDKDKDWLFYYRKNLVLNIETINDENGNIAMYTAEDNTIIDEYNEDGSNANGERLYAYGDVIKNITYEDGNKIIFEYYIGAHLLANLADKKTIDDITYVYYDNFELDENNYGVKYIGEYYYETGSELDKLIKGEIIVNGTTLTFDNYVNSAYDNGNDTVDLYGKYEFSLYNNSFTYQKRIGYNYMDVYTDMADFETVVKKERDIMNTNVFRYDYYNGISFAPKKDIDVHIERGITTAFEKHIKFSEVKTLDDMETYANGSLFNIISDN